MRGIIQPAFWVVGISVMTVILVPIALSVLIYNWDLLSSIINMMTVIVLIVTIGLAGSIMYFRSNREEAGTWLFAICSGLVIVAVLIMVLGS